MIRGTESDFTLAMFEIYRRAKSEAKYPANIFYKMVCDNGGLATAKTLINSPKPSDGYTELHLRGRLDLTVEAVVTESVRWRSLFTEEELAKAEHRLVDYGYQMKPPS